MNIKFNKKQKIELERLCNIWYEKAEELANEYFDESKLNGWQDDEAFVKYKTLIGCRADLVSLLRGL